ncbi:hypothetical protein [Pseudoduganella aquatica]|uniref:Uncharacterized protein n=1 Tax=Pseudoduganella aquatica TaxID=2660641 RepID=A0A7X4KQT2_9BURK|nr:hypothetical protein [Pseudoduganella aquatica]MYN11245.1 hypothetical protein [Pseudoduganella aquatica]
MTTAVLLAGVCVAPLIGWLFLGVVVVCLLIDIFVHSDHRFTDFVSLTVLSIAYAAAYALTFWIVGIFTRDDVKIVTWGCILNFPTTFAFLRTSVRRFAYSAPQS